MLDSTKYRGQFISWEIFYKIINVNLFDIYQQVLNRTHIRLPVRQKLTINNHFMIRCTNVYVNTICPKMASQVLN